MDPTFRAIADQGLAIVGVVALAVALWWVLREYINALKAQRDEAIAGWRAQTSATEKLTDQLSRTEQRLVEEFVRTHGGR